MVAFEIPTLRYGDIIPDFRLSDTRGKAWSRADLLGTWTLMTFGSTSCGACRWQFNDLNAVDSSKPHYRAIAVITGSPLFGSLATLCKQFAAEHHLSYPVLVDDGGGLARRVCDPLRRTPFSVLLDPQGKVRFVFTGYRANVLRQNVARVINSRGIGVRHDRAGFPIDGEVNDHGTRKRLQDVIRQGWTVLTFSKFGCPKCNERTNLLARFHYDRERRCIFLFGSPEEAKQEETLAGRLPIQCVTSATSDLPKKFGAYNVPMTFIFFNGSLAWSELRSDAEVGLWLLLGAIHDGRIIFERKRGALKHTLITALKRLRTIQDMQRTARSTPAVLGPLRH